MRGWPGIGRVFATAAVLAFAAGQAAAVSVNPDGVGQVLLFPYYSARTVSGAANTTFISLSNPTPTAKALGVNFFSRARPARRPSVSMFFSRPPRVGSRW